MDKQHAHQLPDRLDPGQSVSHTLGTAPPDDEPVSDEDSQRFHKGEAWFAERRGKGISTEEVLADFGATSQPLLFKRLWGFGDSVTDTDLSARVDEILYCPHPDASR